MFFGDAVDCHLSRTNLNPKYEANRALGDRDSEAFAHVEIESLAQHPGCMTR